MKYRTVRATKSQIENFKESLLWKDIKHELAAWKKGFKEESLTIVDEAADTNPSSASVLMHLGDINGRVKAVDYLLSLPDQLIQFAEEKEDDS